MHLKRFPTVAGFVALCVVPNVSALAQAKPAQWKLTPAITVGDASSDIIIERVNSLQLHKTGRLLIADGGAKTILVVDSVGKPLPSIGR